MEAWAGQRSFWWWAIRTWLKRCGHSPTETFIVEVDRRLLDGSRFEPTWHTGHRGIDDAQLARHGTPKGGIRANSGRSPKRLTVWMAAQGTVGPCADLAAKLQEEPVVPVCWLNEGKASLAG